MGSATAVAAAATAASAESSESETDNNDERTNKFLLLVDQVRAYRNTVISSLHFLFIILSMPSFPKDSVILTLGSQRFTG